MENTIEALVLKQIKGTITPLEVTELEKFKELSADNRRMVEDLTNPHHLFGAIMRSRNLDVEAELEKARKEIFKR